MKVGDVLKVTIVDDNHLGNGIAKIDNKVIFVPKTIKDDEVEIEIIKVNKNNAYANVISFINKSSNHNDVVCPYYDKCGGCDLLHVSYDREKQLKEEYIKKLFQYSNQDIVSFSRNNYRNKVTLHVENNSLGYYEKDSNKLISIDNCLLLKDSINKTIRLLKEIDLSNVTEIIIKEASGILISIYGSISNNDLNLLKKDFIKSIYIDDRLVYGKEYLSLIFKDIDYSINNNSFFQINNDCAEALYSKIKDLVGKCDNLLDLYCGTGSIGIFLHENVKQITGIEISNDSVKCAKRNIENNNINNYEIINADASCINNNFDVVIVDPPRSGLSKDVIDILNKMKPKKLIYVSCNPSTLKRDANLLSSFNLDSISVFNMFPSTKHIECLSQFSGIDIIKEKLFEMQDEKYRNFQAKLIPTVEQKSVIGVRTPNLRSYAKELVKSNNYLSFIDSLPHKYFDENQLHAFIISEIKSYDECITYIDKFLPYVDNWATCDQMSPKVFKKNHDELLKKVQEWIKSKEVYTVRFGIKVLMQYYLDDEFKPEYLEMVSKIKSEDYYVNMMIAWYFATALSKQYEYAIIYIENRKLDKWTLNKTIQKAIESYRITNKQKEYLRSFKTK